MRLFVDDTCLFYSNKNKKFEQRVNSTLGNIASWPKANKVTLNIRKSNHMLFTL